VTPGVRPSLRSSSSGAVVLAVLLAVVVAWAAPAAAQEPASEIRSVTVDAVVDRSGDMAVREVLAYDFSDERNGGFRNFVPGADDYRIVDFAVTEGGAPRDLAPGFDDPNAGQDVRWFGSADHSPVSGRHDYELRYTVEGAVDVFADVAVLNWQFIGSGFPQIDDVRIDITFPEGAELQAFAHGVLHGVVQPEGNRVSLRVADNPARQFVEVRILAPTSAFDAAPAGTPVRDAILAEEAAFAEQANAQREAARAALSGAFADEIAEGLPGACSDAGGDLAEPCGQLAALLDEGGSRVGQDLTAADAELLLEIRRLRADVDDEVERRTEARNRRIFDVVGPVVAIVAVACWWKVWKRWGEDPDRPADVGAYFRDLPTESPAVIASIDDWGGVDSKAFAATLVDLAQRGWLAITPEDDDHRFTRSQKVDGEPLTDYEAAVLWRLFPVGRHTVTQEELTDEARTERTVSAAWLRGFRAQVKADYDAQGYQARTGCLPWLLHAVILVVVGLVAAGALGVRAWIGGGVAAAATVVLAVATPLLRRRTEKGARRHAEVQGLKKFLEDFSLVDDVPVGHLALYERYLVYAVALGVADRLIAGLRVRFPEVAADPSFAPWYGPVHVGAGFHGGSVDRLADLGGLDAFAGDFTRATAAAFSPPSSSGGGGGGFSGGSSGGGGGGGGGSW
jgi:uncharacterized membrane protein YgcG